jgi:hypothetical protein
MAELLHALRTHSCGDEAEIATFYSTHQVILNQKIILGNIYRVMSQSVFLKIIHSQTYVPDVDIHSDNHVHLRNRPAKTGALKKSCLVPSRVRLLRSG